MNERAKSADAILEEALPTFDALRRELEEIVFVVMRGQFCEGGAVTKAFGERAPALRYVKDQLGDGWVRVPPEQFDDGRVIAAWEADGDWVQVLELPVERP